MPIATKVSAAGKWGFSATLIVGAIAIVWPDVYARIPPGFEAALATGICVAAGYFTKEKVMKYPDVEKS